MNCIGFSTGALAKGDFISAIEQMRAAKLNCIEISALRLSELGPVADIVPRLDLSHFASVTVHCPSRFEPSEEDYVVASLYQLAGNGLKFIVHPDVVFTADKWLPLSKNILFENMDKRKPVARTASELKMWFELFPDAGFCLDLAHARQVDPSLCELFLLIASFRDRIGQIHISELNTDSLHLPISDYATEAYREVAWLLPPDVPVIIESLIDHGQSTIEREIMQTEKALTLVATRRDSFSEFSYAKSRTQDQKCL